MNFKGVISGFEEIAVGLRHAADRVKDGARKQMHRSADKIVTAAKLYCPEDEGNLVASIRKEISYENRGRLQITVVCGGEINGVNVDQYAVIVHEHYEGMLVKGPGKNTLAKMAANPGVYIGSKFIERAADDNKPRLLESMIETVKAAWYMK
jgi:hypothetical protein